MPPHFEHKQNKKETKTVADKNKLDTKDSDLFKSLKDDHKAGKKDLKKNDKSAFDKAYVDMMVTGHEKVLATLDNSLIPNAQNTDLRNHLMKTRGAVAAHLDHAKKLQMGMN